MASEEIFILQQFYKNGDVNADNSISQAFFYEKWRDFDPSGSRKENISHAYHRLIEHGYFTVDCNYNMTLTWQGLFPALRARNKA